MKFNVLKGQDKKAVSLMVSYVLLIVIGISLAILVYYWLLPQINPEEMPKCPDNVALILASYSCDSTDNTITLNLKNQGRFDIDGFFIRGTDSDNKEAIPILGLSDPDNTEITDGSYYFGSPNIAPLEPGAIYSKIFSYSFGETKELKKIQIEPFRIQEDKRGKDRVVLCDTATITQEVSCVALTPPPEDGGGGVPPQSLISWWEFDEAPGERTAVDSESGYNGDLIGNADFVIDGYTNNALYLPNTVDYVQVLHNSNLNPLPDFTIDFYFNTIVASNIINKQGDYSITINSGSNTINVDVGGGIITSDSDKPISLGSWNHVIVLIDNDVLRMILNDVSQSQTAEITTLPTGSADLLIGNGFRGYIDELKIYNYATQ